MKTATSKLSVTVETQGCIWPTSFCVTACQPNLVVVSIDTQQKYVEGSSDVTSRTQAQIQLYPTERTLRRCDGDRGPRWDAPTFIKVKGLANSANWRTYAHGGRYTCTAVFYRLDPRRTHKRFKGSADEQKD